MIEVMKQRNHRRALFASLFSILFLGFFYFVRIPVALAIDEHEQRCLPMRAALLWKVKPATVYRGDYLIWKPYGTLAQVKDEFILKRVAGVPGDHLTIANNKIIINGQLVATGLLLHPLYNMQPSQFYKDEIIPSHEYFMLGTNPFSNDSRYWGYLDASHIDGKAYRLF